MSDDPLLARGRGNGTSRWDSRHANHQSRRGTAVSYRDPATWVNRRIIPVQDVADRELGPRHSGSCAPAPSSTGTSKAHPEGHSPARRQSKGAPNAPTRVVRAPRTTSSRRVSSRRGESTPARPNLAAVTIVVGILNTISDESYSLTSNNLDPNDSTERSIALDTITRRVLVAALRGYRARRTSTRRPRTRRAELWMHWSPRPSCMRARVLPAREPNRVRASPTVVLRIRGILGQSCAEAGKSLTFGPNSIIGERTGRKRGGFPTGRPVRACLGPCPIRTPVQALSAGS